MKMKKMLAAALALTMAVSLSACRKELPQEPTGSTDSTPQSSDTSKEPTGLVAEVGAALKFWTADVNFGKAVAEQFKAKTGIAVEVEEVGLDAAEKMALDGPAGKGADVFMSPHDKAPYLISSGLAQDLDSTIVQNLSTVVNPVATKTVTVDGKQYGVPVSIETTAMFYNKDTIKSDEPAKTFEQIFEEAKGFNDVNENKFWFLGSITNGSGGYPLVSMNGVKIFGEDGTDNDNPGFSDPNFVKVLETMKSFKEVIPISSGDLTMAASGFLDESFKNGKTAYYVNGPWAVQGLKDAGINFGVCPLPTLNGKTLKPMAFVQNAFVSAYSQYPNAAQLFAEFLVSEEAATTLYEQASKITSRTDITNVKGLSEDEYLSPFLSQFSDADPMPTATRMSYYWTIAENIFSAVFDGTLTPEEGAKKAQADFEALVASE